MRNRAGIIAGSPAGMGEAIFSNVTVIARWSDGVWDVEGVLEGENSRTFL